MTRNVVVCLDGTNNTIRSAVNTNVVRLFQLLDLDDDRRQIAYYDPGVGTFDSPAAWTPLARTTSRLAGSAFGAGLRQNLGEAYTYLMRVHEPGDRIFVFGFSRGAYTARALTGMLDVFGIFRPGAENLVAYAVEEFTREDDPRDWGVAATYAAVHARDVDGRRDHVPVHFLGLWDTVKAAGHVWRQLRWPYTRQFPHVAVVRHAVALDEVRRPYREYLVHEPSPDHPVPPDPQDRMEVWFAGVHSDVGGMFPTGARLSDIPLKWMAQQAVSAGLLVQPEAYAAALRAPDDASATGEPHRMGRAWALLGPPRRRVVPAGALVHASVQRRIQDDPEYGRRLPDDAQFVDHEWASTDDRAVAW